jgi:hypothetical protein
LLRFCHVTSCRRIPNISFWCDLGATGKLMSGHNEPLFLPMWLLRIAADAVCTAGHLHTE